MKKIFTKVVAFLLSIFMLTGMIPASVFAAVDYSEREDNYYKVISKDDYELAPGITESEIVLNNAEGSQRQVAHVVEVDVTNPYAKVIPSYKGMIPKEGNYGVQVMSKQAAYAEANGYGNVVAAMNLSLSWYDSAYYNEHPELVGEPLAYMVLDGEVYMNSQGQTSGSQTCLVINFDEKDGEARPDNIPKTQIRSTKDAITGWEEQVIPANFGFLVKDGVNQYKKDHSSDAASRSFVGIKADGTIVMVMNDGRQAPYSTGFNSYEMAEFMLSLGCVYAVNGDGGGSSAFLSQRPGEELKLNCSPSDGAERPTTHGILVISDAPATGEFVRASITAEDDYYTPGSTVKFSALGTDLVGTEAEIPADVTWQLKEDNMGTIEDGVFVSNGTCGTATAQMVYNGEVVGEGSVEIVIPKEFAFAQSVITVPFNKEIKIGLKATVNGGLNDVVLNENDVTFTTTNEELGTFDGFKFTSVSEENAPGNLTSVVTATLNHGDKMSATATLSLGKGSEVLFDFDSAEDIDEWNVGDVNGNDAGFVREISYATSENGEVHNGDGSLRLNTNGLSAPNVGAGGYAQIDLYLDEPVVVENAKSIGFWAYIPDEYEHCWIRVLYWYDSNNDGVFDKKNTISVINQPEVYNTWDESGWKYFSVDVSKYEKVLIPGVSDKTNFGYNSKNNDPNNFRFIEFMFPHTNTNDLWKTHGSINGPYTIYVDNITADFSDAVEDREAPKFGAVNLVENDSEKAFEKYNVVTTKNNNLNITAKVAEDTAKTNATGLDADSAKAYIDGVPVDFKYSSGRFSINDAAVADGIHRVKFEISDKMGNKAVVVRLINVDSGVDASTVQVVPKDASLDRLYGGSVYWMDINATDIETIQAVNTTIDLNGTNHWELDHMEVAEGFSAEYVVDEENNTADITVTRTGENTQTGVATLASLPIRIISFDTDIHMEGYTAETYWKEFDFWPQDLKVDVDKGEITYVKGYDSEVLNAFSNEEFSVDTEMYTAAANMDSAYKAERGTAHVHSAEAMEDKKATCTTDGYTGRTFCEVCDSVVDWGTVSEAKGHSFGTKEALVSCDNCDVTYYYVNGEPQTGWIEISEKYYYFAENGEAVNGKATVDGHTYTFTDHVLTDGAWEVTNEGYTTCWWAGEKLENTWFTIGDKTYHFTRDMMDVGIADIHLRAESGANLGIRYYVFDENGVWLKDYDGFYTDGENVCWTENGVAIYAGVVKDSEGNYYYINSRYLAVKSCTYSIGEAKTNGLVPAGKYEFDAEGKMVNPPVDPEEPTNPPVNPEEPEVKNGLVKDSDGEIRYYENGVAIYKGVVKDSEGNYYYINSTKKAVKNCTYSIGEARTNGLVPVGKYEFDVEGKMVNPPVDSEEPTNPPVDPEEPTNPPVDPEEPEVKNGLVKDSDGEIRYYENGVAIYKGVVKDSEGNYYYINSTKKAVKNCTYSIGEAKTNGLVPVGKYEFDAEGKMVNPSVDPEEPTNPPVDPEEPTNPPVDPEEPEVKNGLVKDSDGEIRYYENGVAIYKGLVQDAEGNYYYINSTKKAVKNCNYSIGVAKTNNLLPAGKYQFDTEGKMIL